MHRRNLVLMVPELLAFLEVPGHIPQSKSPPTEVLIPLLDLPSGRWSEPSQVEYIQNHCRTSVTDPARAAMIALRLLAIRVDLSRPRFNLKQAQSWGLDCLVRIWAVIDRWKLPSQQSPTCPVVVGSFLRTLDTLSAHIMSTVPGTVLAFQIATLYSRTIVGLLQLCSTGSYPTLEQDICASLKDLLRLPRTSTFIHAIGEIMLPSLRELTGDQPRTQVLAHELQVHTPDFILGSGLIPITAVCSSAATTGTTRYERGGSFRASRVHWSPTFFLH